MLQAHFECDYMRGAHPEVMQRLVSTNLEADPGYGLDPRCRHAERLILDRCGLAEGAVHFLCGGTQTNATVIDALLPMRHSAVVCVREGHINVHESGAIEATGHKVIPLDGEDGRLGAEELREYLDAFYGDDTAEHMSEPGMVYISYPTETGTLYTLRQLEELSALCRERGLPLYLDGARMAYGLASPACDLTLADIARIADVFYIGGTKCGALFGEAVVTASPKLIPAFRPLMKRHGALLAKGRLLGVQFEALFEDDLYDRIGQRGTECAMRLRRLFTGCGFAPASGSMTNQQFFRLPAGLIARLGREIGFSLQGAPGRDNSLVRFVTDWSTSDEEIDLLGKLLHSSL